MATTLALSSASALAFPFDAHTVRAVLRDGEPWFVAADVCAALAIGNTTDALRRLDADETTLDSIEGIHAGPGNPAVNLINESGLYSLVLGSRKPEAKRFKKWVTSEVLPAIRKTGKFATQPATAVGPVLQPLSVEQIHGALDAANAAADQVQRAVLKSILDGSADNWKRSRWAVSFVADSAQGAPALVLPIPVGAILGTANDLARSIERNGRSFEEVLTLFDACNRYLHNEAARIAKMHRLPDARQRQEMIR